MIDESNSAQPKCPECGVQGIEHFVSTRSDQESQSGSPWFFVVHCDNCGHVYDIIAKHVFTKNSTKVLIDRG